jgi:hypothetical protein
MWSVYEWLVVIFVVEETLGALRQANGLVNSVYGALFPCKYISALCELIQ